MSMISVRVDKELKESMDKFPHINWSEIIRKAIENTIENEKEHDMAKAVLLNDRIRKKAPENFDSTSIIRQFREDRYGGAKPQ